MKTARQGIVALLVTTVIADVVKSSDPNVVQSIIANAQAGMYKMSCKCTYEEALIRRQTDSIDLYAIPNFNTTSVLYTIASTYINENGTAQQLAVSVPNTSGSLDITDVHGNSSQTWIVFVYS